VDRKLIMFKKNDLRKNLPVLKDAVIDLDKANSFYMRITPDMDIDRMMLLHRQAHPFEARAWKRLAEVI